LDAPNTSDSGWIFIARCRNVAENVIRSMVTRNKPVCWNKQKLGYLGVAL
jgi:hypothetical protein